MKLSKENIACKKITILGMKKSGYSAALLASKFGATIFISDNNKDEIVFTGTFSDAMVWINKNVKECDQTIVTTKSIN